jgi:hypothetical protein
MRHPSTFILISAFVATAAPVLSGDPRPAPLHVHIAPIHAPVVCSSAVFTADGVPVASSDAVAVGDGAGGCDASVALARGRQIRILGIDMMDRSGRREFFSAKTAEH